MKKAEFKYDLNSQELKAAAKFDVVEGISVSTPRLGKHGLTASIATLMLSRRARYS